MLFFLRFLLGDKLLFLSGEALLRPRLLCRRFFRLLLIFFSGSAHPSASLFARSNRSWYSRLASNLASINFKSISIAKIYARVKEEDLVLHMPIARSAQDFALSYFMLAKCNLAILCIIEANNDVADILLRNGAKNYEEKGLFLSRR